MDRILNPVVPFNVSIPRGIYPGKLIRIRGFTLYDSKRFAVNLLNGPKGDVALQICPRFDQKYIARNSIQNLQMGYEENFGTMPIYPGQNFELLILCEPNNFKIAFNNQHFAEFNHRVPFNYITNLAIDGQVQIYSIDFEENPSPNRNIGLVMPPNVGYSPATGQPIPPYEMSTPTPPMMYPNTNGLNFVGMPHVQNNPLYPQQTNFPNPTLGHPTSSYPQQVNGTHPSSCPQPGGYSHSITKSEKSKGFLDKAGMAVAGVLGSTALLGGHSKLGAFGEKLGAAVATATTFSEHLNLKKALKKQKKAHKKALKYGLPIAGAGIGAYALHKGFHGFRRSSSSSSSSSD